MLHLLFQSLTSILWLFIFYALLIHHICILSSFLFCYILFSHSFVIMSFFFPSSFFLTVVFPNCPLACTFIPSCTPVLSLFYPALYVFGFLLILLAGCYHFSGSQQGLVARCSLYSRHMDSRAVGLLNRHLPGKI